MRYEVVRRERRGLPPHRIDHAVVLGGVPRTRRRPGRPATRPSSMRPTSRTHRPRWSSPPSTTCCATRVKPSCTGCGTPASRSRRCGTPGMIHGFLTMDALTPASGEAMRDRRLPHPRVRRPALIPTSSGGRLPSRHADDDPPPPAPCSPPRWPAPRWSRCPPATGAQTDSAEFGPSGDDTQQFEVPANVCHHGRRHRRERWPRQLG